MYIHIYILCVAWFSILQHRALQHATLHISLSLRAGRPQVAFCVCIYIYIYVHIYLYIYIYIYVVHTHGCNGTGDVTYMDVMTQICVDVTQASMLASVAI